jgi:hypothetical protein
LVHTLVSAAPLLFFFVCVQSQPKHPACCAITITTPMQQGDVLSLGPNCSLLMADGRSLVDADGNFLCLGSDGVSLVNAGGG